MHYILLIDTSGDKGIVLLTGDGVVIAEAENGESRNHASAINLLIDQCLKSAGIGLDQLHAVSVIGGPGSYTGLRIGLATAKGLCYVLNIPLLMQNKLSLLALQTAHEYPELFEAYGSILPAREREYFFTLHNKELQCIIEPRHFEENELRSLLLENKAKTLISGVSTKTIQDIAQETNTQLIDNEHIDNYFWSLSSYNSFKCNEFVNLANAEPFYLKQVYTHNNK